MSFLFNFYINNLYRFSHFLDHFILNALTTFTIPATLDMKLLVDGLFFIGMQLVAVSNTGKVAVWQSVQRHWQLQDVEPICSYDAAGSFLLLGCTNGCIYYIGKKNLIHCYVYSALAVVLNTYRYPIIHIVIVMLLNKI